MILTIPNSRGLGAARSASTPPWQNVAISTGAAVGAPLTVASLGFKAGSAAAGAVTAGVALAAMAAITWLESARRRGKQKVAATAIVDEAEPYLQSNVDAWQAGPKSAEDTAVAIAAAQEVFDWIESLEGCGNPELGSAGQRCISERLCRVGEGGCRWSWYDYYLTPMLSYVPPPFEEELHSGMPGTGMPVVPVGGGVLAELLGDPDNGGGMGTALALALGGLGLYLMMGAKN